MKRILIGLFALLTLTLTALVFGPINVGARDESNGEASGAGKTIIEGGTGGASPQPVITVLAFHANKQGGAFECLALAPTSAESGQFEVNAMYVTGNVESVQVNGSTAVLTGKATVTGLGAGTGVKYTFTVHAGGPGTTATLEISGLKFHEILLEGHVNVGKG